MPTSKHTRKGKRRRPKQGYGPRTKTLSGKDRPIIQPTNGDGGLFGLQSMGPFSQPTIKPQSLYDSLTGRTDDEEEARYCYRCERTHPGGTTRLEWEAEAGDMIVDQMDPETLNLCGPDGHQQTAWRLLMLGTDPQRCGVCGNEMRMEIGAAQERSVLTDLAIETLTRDGRDIRLVHTIFGDVAEDGTIQSVRWSTAPVKEQTEEEATR